MYIFKSENKTEREWRCRHNHIFCIVQFAQQGELPFSASIQITTKSMIALNSQIFYRKFLIRIGDNGIAIASPRSLYV